MKKLFISAIALASVCACSVKTDGISTVFNVMPKEGKGPLKSIEAKMNIDEISVSQGISAEVIKAGEEKVVLSAPDDIINEVIVNNSNGKLSIHFKDNANVSSNRVSAKIYVKDFTKISADSFADIKVKDVFSLPKLDAQADSSGSISGNFHADEITIHADSSGDFSGRITAKKIRASADSSGDIQLTGNTQNADLSADSSGGIDAKNLIVENAKLHADSSGDITVSVSKTLEADADSAGSIEVFKKGNLQINRQSEDSAGSISIK